MTPTSAIALARDLYPLTSVADAVLEAWYEWATALAGLEAFGAKREQAVAHLLGHAGEVWARSTSGGASTGGGGGVAGAITSARSSTMALSYGAWAGAGSWAPQSAGDADLMQTPGGRAYLALRDATVNVVAPFVV